MARISKNPKLQVFKIEPKCQTWSFLSFCSELRTFFTAENQLPFFPISYQFTLGKIQTSYLFIFIQTGKFQAQMISNENEKFPQTYGNENLAYVIYHRIQRRIMLK